ncbi:hypothetical protein [Halolamina sp. C58]|uniref:hypothetical protein n=1 Tax=Halolamina sp. C58 TaxID=3421640 RepID=UPI003EB9A0BE
MRVDSETLFNAAAAAISTIAVVIFVVDTQFPYSPVSKLALVVAFLAGVFAVTQVTNDDQLTLLGYAVVVISAVALLLYLTSTFRAGTAVLVLSLLGLALALFGLRTRIDDRSRFVSPSRAKQLFAVVAVLAVIVLAVDVVAGGLAYEIRTQQAVEITSTGERQASAQVGEVVVSNPGPFPQRVDIPSYEACAAGNWSAYRIERPEAEPHPVRAYLRVDNQYGEHVFGFGERTYGAAINLNTENADGERFPVERTDRCPDDDEADPYVAVYERADQ